VTAIAEPGDVCGGVSGAPVFDALWAELAPIGRTDSGGYRRLAWGSADLECRAWFERTAQARGMSVETDRNGNLWAWWGDPTGDDVLVVGSHLDSVPDGGAFDGPLGIVAAFAALDVLRAHGVEPTRPVAVVAFSDEEGARFGVACVGSRLATGVLMPDRARGLTDGDGVTLEAAMRAAGHAPGGIGPDPERLRRIGAFIELHIEQGRVPLAAADGRTVRGLIEAGVPVGVASSIHPHGRWRFDLAGRADHAGTTALSDRSDPMLHLATLVTEARAAASDADAVATVGKVIVHPNGVNAIPSSVTAWLDVRGASEAIVRSIVERVARAVGCEAVEESWTPIVEFAPALRDDVQEVLSRRFGHVPVMPTAAGHDAGILATAGVPAAMIFVRNPSGTSHSPAESATVEDRHAAVDALVDVIGAFTRR